MRKFYEFDPRLQIDKITDVMPEPRIIHVTEFNEEALEDFHKDMDDAHHTGQPVIPIIIDSYGGSAYGVLGMISAIENSRLPVATIVTSKAMSAGAILFCFGTEGYRFMDRHATMMIHDVGSFTAGKVEDIKADTKQLDVLNRDVYRRASKHLGHEAGYLGKFIKENHHVDWYLTAVKAKKHNIANHLRVPSLTIKINLEMKFK